MKRRGRRRSSAARPRVSTAKQVARPEPRPRTYVWRRLHAGDIIAEAAPVPGMGVWRISAYRVERQESDLRVGRAFSFLTDAHAAADELVQREFTHVCDAGVCGRWLRWLQDGDPA